MNGRRMQWDSDRATYVDPATGRTEAEIDAQIAADRAALGPLTDEQQEYAEGYRDAWDHEEAPPPAGRGRRFI